MISEINYTGVDPTQILGNKKEEQQASVGAREPRTGDPGTGDPVTGEAGEAIGINGNFEGGKPMGSLAGISGNFEDGKPMGSLGGITGRDHWSL